VGDEGVAGHVCIESSSNNIALTAVQLSSSSSTISTNTPAAATAYKPQLTTHQALQQQPLSQQGYAQKAAQQQLPLT
jgi:hypothetical protein